MVYEGYSLQKPNVSSLAKASLCKNENMCCKRCYFKHGSSKILRKLDSLPLPSHQFDQNNPRTLWKTIDNLVQRRQPLSLPKASSQRVILSYAFANYFIEKIFIIISTSDATLYLRTPLLILLHQPHTLTIQDSLSR